MSCFLCYSIKTDAEFSASFIFSFYYLAVSAGISDQNFKTVSRGKAGLTKNRPAGFCASKGGMSIYGLIRGKIKSHMVCARKLYLKEGRRASAADVVKRPRGKYK